MTTHKLWISQPDQRTHTAANTNRSIAFRKAMIHDGQIEQFTEKLPRRWWQLKAPTRIRIRRVRRESADLMFFNCQGKLTEIKV